MNPAIEASAAERAEPGSPFALRCACLAFAGVACVPGLVQLAFLWQHSEYLGHAYVIPITAIWLGFSRRARIAYALHHAPGGRGGVVLVLLASLFEAVGVLSQAGTLAGIGIPLLLASTAYAVGGIRLLRACSVPLVFLLLMVPPPTSLQDRLLAGLKPVVASVAVALVQQLGFTVAVVGNRILTPAGELFVADACSGLTSLVTLLPLAGVVAYFLSHGIWRRLVVVASVVPLAVLGNIARVAITIALVDRFGLGSAEGLLHESFGVSTFVVGTVALIAVAKALR